MGEFFAGGYSIGAIVIAVGLVWAGALVYFDLRDHRLPDYLTLPAAVIAIGWALVQPERLALLFAGAAWPALYLLQVWIQTAMAARRHDSARPPVGLGGGDIKLSASLGVIAAAAGGIVAVLVAAGSAAVLSLCAAMLLRRGFVAHGPAMILATVMISILHVE